MAEEKIKIPYKKHVLVCTHDTCKEQGGEEIFLELKEKIKEKNLKATYRPSRVICLGQCGLGPNVGVWPEGVLYTNFCKEKINRLIEDLCKD